LEPAKGNVKENVAYCSKDGKVIECGERPDDGGGKTQKEKWDRCRELAVQGNIEDIDSDLYVRYYSTLQRIAKDHMKRPENLESPCGLWIYGRSGSGKSHYARELCPDAYLKMCNKWWDGYQGEDDVIIDDIDPVHKVLGHHLKIWLDKYPFIMENKGGARCIRPRRVVITSQYKIEEIFEDPACVEAIRRRCYILEIHVNTEGERIYTNKKNVY
jgi:hypothetical protein